MQWKVGYKITHPFNPDWGVGEVVSIGPQGRNIAVYFPNTEEKITLSTHDAAYKRWVFHPGIEARVTSGEFEGQEVRIVSRNRNEDDFDYYTTDNDLVFREDHLRPKDKIAGCLERLASLQVDSVDNYENRYAGVKLNLERQAHGMSGILGARVTLFPHQLHVAYRVARLHPVRALLADEVGLGKTIEAGMIYSALRQAGRASRVLVLTPSSLTIQWLGEFYRKFHDVFVLIDDERLEDAAIDHPDMSPWQVYPRAVCSQSFLAANPLLALDASELEGGWDLIIVDEAHHLRYDERGGNALYEVVEPIVENTRNVLFLTATPMELDRKEYFGLLRLLQPSLFHEFELFEVQLEEIASANELAVALEAALGESPEDDEPEVGREEGAPTVSHPMPEDLPDRIADAFPEQIRLELLAERAIIGDLKATRTLLDELIHLHPLGDTVFSNTRARVGGFKKRTVEIRALPISQARRDIYDDVLEWVRTVAAGGVDSRSKEAQGLFELIQLAAGPLAGLKSELIKRKKRARNPATIALFEDLVKRCETLITEDTPRLDELLREVRDCVAKKEKLLIFVHHIADLQHLRDRIEARVGVRVATFHERLPPADRDIQVAMFRAPDGYPVLLSTEAGGEGRNFQFCHRLVHYDLPPSPNRVEQRIGRLDRIGQRYDVHSLVMITENTLEHELAKLLDSRVGVFRHTIGGLDPVLERLGFKVIELAISQDNADPAAWATLATEANELLHGARDIITRGLDHLLHRGGFDPTEAAALESVIPDDLESRLEEFVIEFCEQTGITVQEKDGADTYFLALDRYCTLDSLPCVPLGTGYVGTFNRVRALDREDFDYFATGHPLVEGIFNFISDAPYGTSALRKFRTTHFKPSCGVQFNFRMEPDARQDVDAPAFFPPCIWSIPVDLDGTVRLELLDLLTARYSQAFPLEPEELRELAAKPGWLTQAYEVATREAGTAWEMAVKKAVKDFEDFARREISHLEAFFEHRLDSAEARAAFSRNPADAENAELEIQALHEEWKARMSQLESRRDNLKRGAPSLDSVALYLIERPASS